MPTQHNKAGGGFGLSIALIVALAAYSLSFGPACWLANRKLLPEIVIPSAEIFYMPMIWAYHDSPDPIRIPFAWYVDVWI